MGRALTDKGVISLRTLLVTVVIGSILIASPFCLSCRTQNTIELSTSNNEPILLDAPDPPPEINAWAEDEFIVSYDEDGTFDAMAPDIAVAPPGSPWEGSIHTVWAELNNSVDDPYIEIHYSMSDAVDRGLEWSNDDAAEEDKLISQDFTTDKGAAN
ncbi:MAG: hypothetical protein KAJ33_08165, partial [Thermoplasmata archaeon]|nr:hypothetical protein [Thermoplasmata archaeon]